MLVVAGVCAPDSNGTIARMPMTISANAKRLVALLFDLAKELFITVTFLMKDESCIEDLAQFLLI